MLSMSNTKPTFVLDCSVTMTWLFEDEITAYTEIVLQALQKNVAVVPHIWLLEVYNVLLVAERKLRITFAQAVIFQKALKQLPIQQDQSQNDSGCVINDDVYRIAREFRLSSYDASYLELAFRKKLPIATLDKALILAAKNSGLEVY